MSMRLRFPKRVKEKAPNSKMTKVWSGISVPQVKKYIFFGSSVEIPSNIARIASPTKDVLNEHASVVSKCIDAVVASSKSISGPQLKQSDIVSSISNIARGV